MRERSVIIVLNKTFQSYSITQDYLDSSHHQSQSSDPLS